MSGLTLTAGLSFSGGITITDAPPTTNTEAWFGGASLASRSTVDRITYATDTATASVRGPLSAAAARTAAASNISLA